MRDAYLSALYSLARIDNRVIAAVGDNGAIVYDKFRRDFPAQFINFGISEANMVSACAGMASCGLIPFVYTIAPFLTMRAYEQVRNDVCLQEQNVKMVGTGAGVVYSSLGPTHHGTEDLAVMRVLPNLSIFSPASPREVYQATLAAYQLEGPVYLRLGTNREDEIYGEDYIFTVGQGVILREGLDISIIATGSIVGETLKAAGELEKIGISARVINMPSLKPLDESLILQAAQETGAIISLEEHNIIGGLGSAVAELLAESGLTGLVFQRMGLCESFARGYGKHQDLKAQNGLDSLAIVLTAQKLLARKSNLCREGELS